MQKAISHHHFQQQFFMFFLPRSFVVVVVFFSLCSFYIITVLFFPIISSFFTEINSNEDKIILNEQNTKKRVKASSHIYRCLWHTINILLTRNCFMIKMRFLEVVRYHSQDVFFWKYHKLLQVWQRS